jgi:hypothetical protein
MRLMIYASGACDFWRGCYRCCLRLPMESRNRHLVEGDRIGSILPRQPSYRNIARPVPLLTVSRSFFRIVVNDPPTEEDFKSNFAKGRGPRRSEILDSGEYRSLSVFARLEDALAVQRLFPKLGSHLAEIELADDDPDIAIQKEPHDPADSHHNLRGEPAEFLRRVRRVFPAVEPSI